jgi:hypothetical protein
MKELTVSKNGKQEQEKNRSRTEDGLDARPPAWFQKNRSFRWGIPIIRVALHGMNAAYGYRSKQNRNG